MVLGQKIVFDFGRNVVFEGGLAIWERAFALNLIFKEENVGVHDKAKNAEIYFESGDIDNLFKRLSKEEVEIIHSIRQEPWGQKVFRIFDLDGHILEFAESMESVVLRLDKQGFTLDEIAKKSKMPKGFVKKVLKKE